MLLRERPSSIVRCAARWKAVLRIAAIWSKRGFNKADLPFFNDWA